MIDNVLFVAPSAYPLGGVATWLDYLLPGLADRGWRPVLGLTAGHFHDVNRYREVHPWRECISIENPTGTPEGRVRVLMDAIRKVRPRLVAVVNIPDTYAAVARMRAVGEFAPHVVMTNHSMEEHYLQDAETWSSVLDGLIYSNRLGCRLAEERAAFEPTRIHYAPYGVDLPSRISRVHPNDGVLRIAYSGRLDEFQKRANDIPAILAGLARLGIEYELLIAGAGPCEAALKLRLGPQIESGRVRFMGVLNPSELGERVYSQADVLLVTSYWETGPIVIWEAMAHGLPVLTSSYLGSGLEGSLKDGKNCMMYPVGASDVAALQLQRMQDAQFRASLAAAGRLLVQERYTCHLSVQTWDACLRAVLETPIRRGAVGKRAGLPAGRLDRYLGPERAETVRTLLGRGYRHAEPGGEWPHSHNAAGTAQDEFWRRAKLMDRS